MATNNLNLIKIAKIVSAHGIKGAVRIKSFAANPLKIVEYKLYSSDHTKQLDLQIISSKGNTITAKIMGVDDRNHAESLVGCDLYICRDDLPSLEEEEFYYADLIGIELYHQDVLYGKISAVNDYGAGAIIEVSKSESSGNNNQFLYPFKKEIFPEIDIKNKKGKINLE